MASEWSVTPSRMSVETINPIRAIVDKIKRPENHPLPIIDLALGDPSVFGNLPPTHEVTDSVDAALSAHRIHGYTHSCGLPQTRAAVAKFESSTATSYTPDDVILTCGASQAILLACQLLANPGDFILSPAPAFPLYETIAGHMGVTPLRYPLVSERNWEIDLEAMEKLIVDNGGASKVKLMILTNPGNPTGSNWSRSHVEAIAALALKHKIPVVADEIYSHMVFTGETFTPFADVAGDVPVLTISGTAKKFLIPGWRVGWLLVQDRAGVLARLRGPLVSLTQVIMGTSTVLQEATTRFLETVPAEYYAKINATLEEQSKIVVEACTGIPGMEIIAPQGAMYAMIRVVPSAFKDIPNDEVLTQLLLNEQNVMVLPGSCFKAPGFIRVVFCAPPEKLKEFASRLRVFAEAHAC